MENVVKPGLKALLGTPSPQSFTPHEFMSKHWPDLPFVVHGLDKSIAPLTELNMLQSLDQLLNSWPMPIQAHLPDLKDEASAIDVSPQDARKLFANKMGLLFNRANMISPVLDTWVKALQKDLGLPAMTDGRCILYATPAGGGTAPHFDQNVNFVLQLHGTKKWIIAPNEHVLNPTQRQTMGQDIDPELEPYARLPLPKRMPTQSQGIILKPGSLLFLPRGYWHSTQNPVEQNSDEQNYGAQKTAAKKRVDLSPGDLSSYALALNFTFSQPTWIDLFTTALRSRLSLSAEWRELADGVSSQDAQVRELAEYKLDALLMELREDLPHWQAGDILGATEGLD